MKLPKHISDVWPISLTVVFYFVTVAFANLSGGTMAALRAGGFQILWTLPLSIIVFKTCSYFSLKIEKFWLSYILAIAVPTLVSVIGTVVYHSLLGSPEPYYSAVPTLLATPIATTLWAIEKHREKRINISTS